MLKEKTMTELDPDEIRTDIYSNISGASVRMTHIPTGVVAESAWHTGPYRARREALRLLRGKLATREWAQDDEDFEEIIDVTASKEYL